MCVSASLQQHHSLMPVSALLLALTPRCTHRLGTRFYCRTGLSRPPRPPSPCEGVAATTHPLRFIQFPTRGHRSVLRLVKTEYNHIPCKASSSCSSARSDSRILPWGNKSPNLGRAGFSCFFPLVVGKKCLGRRPLFQPMSMNGLLEKKAVQN